MQRVAPAHTACWEVRSLLRDEQPVSRSRDATNRLLELAAGLEPGAHLSFIIASDGLGEVSIRLHTDTSDEQIEAHIAWVGQGVAAWTRIPDGEAHLVDLTEIGVLTEVLPTVQAPISPEMLSFDWPSSNETTEAPMALWPIGTLDDAMEILQAMTGVAAQVRVHLAPATDLEKQMAASLTRRSVQSQDPVVYSQYMGAPVRVRAFVGQAGTLLSPRLRAALGRHGIGLKLVPRDLDLEEIRAAWDGDVFTLSGSVQPFGVAQCIVRFPACGEQAVLCGVPTEDAETPPVPLEADAEGVAGLRLGTAVGSAGRRKEVRVSPEELLLHTQVLGSTGTGKSTLLAALTQEAFAAGFGVTVIDSHGPLIDRILDELPEEAVDRTVVVRSGRQELPVRVNPFRCGDADMVGEVLLQVMRELLDPNNQGFLGPRFERIFGQTLRAQRVLFGENANLAAFPHFMRSREQVRALANAVRTAAPALADELSHEFANLSPDDFGELVGWINAKYQRMTGTPEMRAILATGEDAVDVTQLIDDRQVLLIDLAAPTIGPLGAQFLGEIWLTKHWAALARRRDTTAPHLLIVDEAHLFASGLLPRLLAEARKFGVGVVLAHQHLEQLTPHLRDATLATTSNVIVFRSGPREASAASSRLGSWAGGPLTRLPRFHAASTLSLGKQQSDAFTLFVDHNDRVPETSFADDIATASDFTYVLPFQFKREITARDVDERIRARLAPPATARTGGNPPDGEPAGSSFLDGWLAARKEQAAEPDAPSTRTQG